MTELLKPKDLITSPWPQTTPVAVPGELPVSVTPRMLGDADGVFSKSPWPPGWKCIERFNPPAEVRLLIWGGASMRFGIIDKNGNWRACHNGPIKVAPKYWRFLPSKPVGE